MKQKLLSHCLAVSLALAACHGLASEDGKAAAAGNGIVKSDDHSTVVKSDDDKSGSGKSDDDRATVPSGGGSGGSTGGTPGGSSGGAVGTPSSPKVGAGDDHPWVPLINPLPGSVDFGPVQTGGLSVSQTVMVRNGGAGPVTYTGFKLQNVSAGASFNVAPRASGLVPACVANSEMAAGASCALSASFQPASGGAGAGLKTASLMPSFLATAPAGAGSINGLSPGAKLAGTGVLPSGGISTGSLSFLVVGPGHDATPQFLTLSNAGSGALTFLAASVESGDSRFGTYSLKAIANGGTPPCTPALVLPVGAACSLQVGYHGTLIGTAKGRIVVDLGGGAARPAPVALTAQTTLASGVPRRN
jgi:hypothetical protein